MSHAFKSSVWIVHVWDNRDTQSNEPSSYFGEFKNLSDALKSVHDYMETENGKHIQAVDYREKKQ